MLSSLRAYLALLATGLLVAIGVLIATAPGVPRVAGTTNVGDVSVAAISNQLSVPGVEQLDDGEQEIDQLADDRTNPAAVLARRLSRTRYEHLSAGAALEAIGKATPTVVRTSPGGIGTLPTGVHVSRYLSTTSARLDLPGGRHAIVESMTPAATRRTSSGYAPVDLALHETPEGYVADNPAVPVNIPHELASGVRLDSSGVSLTPLDAAGAPLHGSGRLDGGSVVYPNTATDADTAAKPTDTGMEVYDLLRSADSPQELSYRVGLPQGASLESNGTGSIKVVDAGSTLAVIPAPSAQDAAGTVVPVTTSVSGDRLRLQVDHRTGEYLYPIVVDPTVTDAYWTKYENVSKTNWRFVEGEGDAFKTTLEPGQWQMLTSYPNVEASEWGAFLYPTQGESHIYETVMELKGGTKENTEQHLVIAGEKSWEKSGWEGNTVLPHQFPQSPYNVCAISTCGSTGGTGANVTAFWMNTTVAGEEEGNATIYGADVYIAQTNGPAIVKDTTKELNSKGERNAFYGSGGWLSSQDKTIALFDASDPGVGVSEVQYTVGSTKWSEKPECPYSVQCVPSFASSVSAANGGGLPEGERTIEAKALDSMGSSSTVAATIKVDRAAPHEITLSGLPTGNVINDATQGGIKLVGHATDGVTGTPSSGVASLKLAVDGHEIGSPNGSCSPGPCTATGEWTLNGEEYSVGEHTLTVTATDNAGNVATNSSTKFNVEHARPVSFGPGELNPVTGEFDLEETDVSISTIGTPLTVVRGYDSREPGAGGTYTFNAPWTMSAGGAQELVRLPNGSMTLISTTGAKSTFTAAGGGKFEPPAGDSSLVLTANAAETEYTLQDNGSSTVFKHVVGDSESVFRASIATGTNGTESTQYIFELVPPDSEPQLVEELGPVPAGVSCTPTLKPGCRALRFNYAAKSSATGENESQWGNAEGRLFNIEFETAEEKEGKVVQVTKPVARYEYDGRHRLRAEWDPRISPALKTTYGYDSEGHVTVLSRPGQESWVFTYGTSSTDTRPGRLIKEMQAPASEALWNGEVLKNTAAPTLSGTPSLKVRMAVSNGSWSPKPIAYGYQWQDCNGSGAECKAIPGATNANYTPVESDLGHTLVAQVTATNGGGSVTVSTSPSATVGMPTTMQAVDANSLNAVACVPATSDCVVSDSKGNAYYSTNVSVGSSTWTSWSGPGTSPSEALGCPSTSLCLIADGEKSGGDGTLYSATSLGESWTQTVNPSYGVDAISCVSASFCLEGQDNDGYFRYSTSPSSSWTLEHQGSAAMKAVYCLSSSFCAMGDASGKVYVATSTAQIESAEWKESTVDSGTSLNGIVCTSTSSCVAVDAAGNVLNLTVGSSGEATAVKHDIDATNNLTAVTCSGASCVAVDAHGNLFISTNSGSTWPVHYELKDDLTSVSCSSSKLCATVDTTGHFLAFDPTGAAYEGGTEAEALAPQPGTTVEYNVPVSGSGAPYSLSSSEAAKWAQTDLPVEATAIFPTDEAVGWPAPDYRRATIDYFDLEDHVVNVASPDGGIVTSEYNSHNDVTRSLTADNRALALKEGSKSAEVSQTLDTQNTYNSEGNELLSTLGPQHTVKIAEESGEAKQARSHVVYSYDEGEPETGGPYRLVTKVKEGATVAGRSEDADVRTTKKSYAGQNDLGWTLREPTAITVDPGSEPELVYSTVYDPNTGKVTETRTPGAGAANESYIGYEYSSSFGGPGIGNGRFNQPDGIAIDSEGNIWVADSANNRVEEFSSAGTFIQQFTGPGCENETSLHDPTGVAIDKSGDVWVVSSSKNCVIGYTKTGTYIRTLTGGSLLSSPMGIAYSSYNNRLYVTSSGVGRVLQLNPENNSLVEVIGKPGTGNGEFTKPEAIAVDSSGNIYVGDSGKRVQKLSATGAYISQFGSGHLNNARGIALDSKGDVLVADGPGNDVQSYSPSGTYQYSFGEYGSGTGQLSNPFGIVLDGSNNAYVVDSANYRIEKWLPSGNNHKSRGNGGTHGMQTIYYTAGSNSEISGCGNHPEWAGLPCEKRPAAQPENTPVTNLLDTKLTYNLWDEPVESVEWGSASQRSDTDVYDEAGRMIKETVTSSAPGNTALPSVEYEYNPETGAPTKSKTTVEGTTQTLESVYNKRGELTSYKDADGNTASFNYDSYGRLESINDGKGTQTYSYDTTTGLTTKLVDSAAGTFTASYDAEGNLTTVGDPNGMNVNHTYNSAGEETGIEYVKTTNCSTSCVWYSQTESPSIHGQTLTQSSTLSNESYTYDGVGRLTKVQETPAGEGCTTRIYAYDVETNIDSLTTRPPGTGGACASEGGTAVNHTYDSGNRLIDAGTAYNGLGDIVTLPAGDAGGYELSSTYYADGTLATQSQNGQTVGYYLDPSGRARQIVSTGTTNSTITYHYAGDGRSPAWTEGTSGEWTRNIYGFEGLVAIQTNGASPVLQIQDLKGNVVGTASLSETATELLSKGETATEYGVPRTSSPPKYSWQGAAALRTELPSGVVAMGARSYVPEIGRFLQPDPIEGGSANAYSYTYGDPVNTSDPSGEYTVATPSWVSGFFSEQAEIETEAAVQRAAEAQAAMEEAEEKSEEEAEAAQEASEAAMEADSGGGGKGKKGKKPKGPMARRVNPDLLMVHDEPDQGRCEPVARCKREEHNLKENERRYAAAKQKIAREEREGNIRNARLEAEIASEEAMEQSIIEEEVWIAAAEDG